MNSAIYQAHLLDHSRNPRNKGLLEEADVVQKGDNPSCGDQMTLYIKYADDVVSDVRFDGVGCAVSQAGASLLTEKIKGMSRTDLEKLTDVDMYDLLRVEIHGSREKCALLTLNTLREALRAHVQQ
jgi:nitrogen fixation NifU-like protein